MFFSSSTTRMDAIAPPLASWQLEREAAAVPDLAVEEDPAAVCLHDVAHDREPEAGGAGLATVLALDEALEDALALLRGDARAGVGHADAYHAIVRARSERHLAAARRVAQRVRDQVRERPENLRGIAGDAQIHLGDREVQCHAALPGLQGKDARAARHDVADVHVLPLQRDAHRP